LRDKAVVRHLVPERNKELDQPFAMGTELQLDHNPRVADDPVEPRTVFGQGERMCRRLVHQLPGCRFVARIEVCRRQSCPEGGHRWILLGSVGDERDELSHPALLVPGLHELYAVERKGVGLPACRAHLERRGGELLGLFGVAVQQGERGVVKPATHNNSGCPSFSAIARTIARRSLASSNWPARTASRNRCCRKYRAHGVVQVTGRGECLREVRQLRGERRRGVEGRAAPVHDIDEYGPITQATSDRFGLVGQGEAAFEWAVVDELCAQRGEKTRPLRAVGVGKGVERRFDHFDLLGVDLPHALNQPRLLASAAATRRSVSPSSRACSSRLQEGLAERGDAGLALGRAEAEQQVDATGRVDTDSLSRQLEGLAEVAHGVVGSESPRAASPARRA
jgi:hypothetical protein